MSEDSNQIAAFLESGTRGDRQTASGFIGDDVGQGGFAQTRWAVKKDMVDGFLPQLGRFKGDFQGLDHFRLADVIDQVDWPQGENFRLLVYRVVAAGDQLFISVSI